MATPIEEFVVESDENLAQMDIDLLDLERADDPEKIARVFRAIHTVKGSAGFLGFQRIEALTHAAESLLSQMREGKQAVSQDAVSALLEVVQALRRMLAEIKSHGREGALEFRELIDRLQVLQGKAVEPRPEAAPRESDGESAEAVESDPFLGTMADHSIRVDVSLLDKLMSLVGELVLTRNQFMQLAAAQEDALLAATTQHLNLITTDLQAGVMRTRMQPIGNVWSRSRLVRDLAAECGKDVRIESDGRETELDKTILEAIRDPLTHLVRNAVDHGIETPATRVAQGKPAAGKIHLRAYHEGGKVNIEITDDGRGIDVQRVRARAIDARLISAEEAQRLNERELLNMIFLPGFSTAEQVTRVSGRGVGMDVVRTNIERIGGTVDVSSQPGHGTTVRMKIPLTLAIIPALTVTCGGDAYCIPQAHLLELVRVEAHEMAQSLERIHGASVYRLRGNLLPLVSLHEELKVAWQSPPENGMYIVVLRADDRQFGLVVERVHDTEEIVVKPLQKQLKGIGLYAGATIMGDGAVALILDVMGLAQQARVVAGARQRTTREEVAPQAAENGRHNLLLFQSQDGGRMAIPLSLVARLEEFPRSKIERVGPREVVQYRGEILPLVHIGGSAGRNGHRPGDRTDNVPVVVYAHQNARIGLVIGQILDIVDESVTVESRAAVRPGVTHTAIVADRVTEILDIHEMIRAADPDLLMAVSANAVSAGEA